MNERTILIANNKTQQRHELHTNATTLGELKSAMRDAGIDYSGLAFTEGITKTQLLSDDSLLPTNVIYKGQPTNNLVMLLTNTTKNIASGCEERNRKEAYEIIKEWGEDAQRDIKNIFHKNYTQVKTEFLWQYIDDCRKYEGDKQEEENEEVNNPEPPVETNVKETYFLNNGEKYNVTQAMWLAADTVILKVCKGQVTITDEDIDDMIANL